MRNKFPFTFAVVVMAVNLITAQDQTVQNSSNIGMPPNGVFSGSDFESVQLQNGNLHIDIPIWSLKGRGLGTGSKFIYDSLGWTSSPPHCDHTSGVCSNHITLVNGNNLILGATSPFAYSAGTPVGRDGPSPSCNTIIQHSNYTLREPDGTKHHFLPDPSWNGGSTGSPCGGPLGRMYADDGSGWIMNVDPSSGALISAISEDGTRITWPEDPSTASQGVEVRDSNGNYLYYPPDNTTGNGTDTLGRTVYGGATYVDSNGNQQSVQITTEAVTIQTNLCPLLGADTCGEYVRTGTSAWNLAHIITLPNGMTYTIEYVQGQYGQPSSMTLPTGGQVSWTWYQPSGVGKSTMGPMVQQRTLTANGVSGTWQYSNESSAPVTVTDPAGNQTVTSFTCPIGRYVDANMNGGETDPPCYVTSVKYYNGSAASGTLLKTVATTYTTSGAVLPQVVTTTLNDANLVSKTFTTYDSIAIPLWTSDNFTWGNPTEQDEYDYGTGAAGALLRKATTTYLHPSNSTYQKANIADRVSSRSTYDGSGNLVASAQNFYDDQSFMTADLGNATNHDASYSTAYFVRGNATRIEHWLNTNNSWLVTDNGYDDLGNLRQSQDPGGHITQYDYSDSWYGNAACVPGGVNTQAFVRQVINADNYDDTYNNYYPCTGLLGEKRDANDLAAGRSGAITVYALMNRPTQVSYSDGGKTSWVYGDNLASFPAIFVNRIELMCLGAGMCAPGIMQSESWKAFDGFGRVERTASTNGEQSSSTFNDQADTCYDNLGNKQFERYSYQGPGWITMSFPCSNSSSSPGDTFAYDPLGRLTKTTNTDGSVVNTSYWGNWTTVTDQAGRSRKSKSDALGRLVEVCEADPATGTLPPQGTCTYETDYQYDALNDLTRVDQKGNDPNSADWRTRLFTYDSLGRLLTANNPETGTICYGTWSGSNCVNGYDADGNLIAKSAPAPNNTSGTVTTTYNYDPLHRLIERTVSNSNLIEAWGYDDANPAGVTVDNPMGHMTFSQSFYSPSVQVKTLYSYDSRGRLEFEQQLNQRSNANQWFKCSYGYNLDGSPQSVTYPSGRTLTYQYPWNSSCPNCASNRPSGMIDSADGINYVTNAHYTAWGTPASAVYGNTASFNGITLAELYNSRMQPLTITANTPSATIFSLGYQFNYGAGDNGNVMGITNGRDSTRSQSFSYDYLNRLTSAWTPSSSLWGNNYSYDLWGNLWQKAIMSGKSGGENLSSSVDNLTNRLNGFGYDAAGNMTTNGPATYTYDAENRLISAPGITFDYDAEGRRVQKSDGKLYWYGQNDEILEETDLSGNLQEEYIYFNGDRVARREPGLNFVTNAGFENGFTGWSSGESYQVVNAGAHSGTSYLQLSANTSASAAWLAWMSVVPGQMLHFGGWVNRQAGNGYVRWKLVAADSNYTPVTYPGAFNAGTGVGWQFQEEAYTVPASGVSYVRLYCEIYLANTASTAGFDDGFLGGDVHYYLSDHLNSTDVVVDSTGGVEEENDYYPFGGERVITDLGIGNNYKFTGKERDPETGLDDFEARYYNSALARFVTPDWAAKPTAIPYAKFGDPQTLNLYSYVENSPVNEADADGHTQAEGEEWIQQREQAQQQQGVSASANSRQTANAQTVVAQLEEPTEERDIEEETPQAEAERALTPEPTPAAPVGSQTAGNLYDNLVTDQACSSDPEFAGTVKPGGLKPLPPGENAAAARGRAEHAKYNPGEGYAKNFRLPSGRIVDGVNLEKADARELKSRKSVARGQRQIKKYGQELERMTGRKFSLHVDTYEPD